MTNRKARDSGIAAHGFKALATLLCLGATLTGNAQAQTQSFSFIGGTSGMWVFNNASGRASFCIGVKSGTTGNPMGKCNVIGSVGTSTAGFTLTQYANNELFIVSKTNGAIFQCSVVFQSGTNPVGGCAQIASTTNLL
ncbi:hypothetical protein G8A07_14240 [Roseateles sp. DAIF2]|uniref:hypothetical protein n=1 Tax=Roseateles sp. DAIF2 TaxID=2714952 RepID=UPI0018A24C4E|nr:hypothetical protein [Roseateles sp. DAIF2]QPF73964.1 hypothetical protein G8A07_14240 [Roseateles sp. DAIF2]